MWHNPGVSNSIKGNVLSAHGMRDSMWSIGTQAGSCKVYYREVCCGAIAHFKRVQWEIERKTRTMTFSLREYDLTSPKWLAFALRAHDLTSSKWLTFPLKACNLTLSKWLAFPLKAYDQISPSSLYFKGPSLCHLMSKAVDKLECNTCIL